MAKRNAVQDYNRSEPTKNGSFPHPSGAMRGNNFKYDGYHFTLRAVRDAGCVWADVNTGKRYFITYEKLKSISHLCQWSSKWVEDADIKTQLAGENG